MHSIGSSANVAVAFWYAAWKCGRWWGRAEFREHSDDDAEEARQLRHDAIVA
jgi:hypothetical protein